MKAILVHDCYDCPFFREWVSYERYKIVSPAESSRNGGICSKTNVSAPDIELLQKVCPIADISYDKAEMIKKIQENPDFNQKINWILDNKEVLSFIENEDFKERIEIAKDLNIDRIREHETNKCPKCKYENPKNAKFCYYCGKELQPKSKYGLYQRNKSGIRSKPKYGRSSENDDMRKIKNQILEPLPSDRYLSIILIGLIIFVIIHACMRL